ncbi:dentin sialophosphoprotein-like isoform X13 [Myzus persicae]|uniref:dentin sialophosphoprotein-like isoform X13 n=1 Tax=Myzus persicae TaxID=13164 RepID=UPI000B9301DC|nr:dentin sialophosphoprotein-like isoform X13 [Myzus persicae]
MIGLKLDNDDLSKIFPKCRPSTVRSTDLNLNPLCDDDTDHDMDLTQSNERQRNRCDNIRGNGTRKRSIRGIRKFRSRRRSDSDASQDSSLETSIEDDEEEINENMDEDDDDESDIKNASSESGGMCNVDIGAANRTRNSNKINLTSQQSTYKLRDSRIIEIAGGREVYSQSRSKPGRKTRQLPLPTEVDWIKSPGRVWELRNRGLDASSTESSREISEVFSTDVKPTKHQRPLSIELDDPVLFDDIHNDMWDKVQHDSSIGHYGMHHHKNTYQTIDSCQHHLNYKTSQNGDINMIANSNRSEISSTENTDGLIRSQCEIQTNDFNGSPKQYREEEQSMPSLLSSPTLYMPRPGFPQRVIQDDSRSSSPSPTMNFDYLYEFSETRKVLEEFFKSGAENQDNQQLQFQDLEYELRRRIPVSEQGNTYVGMHLSNEDVHKNSQLSPHKHDSSSDGSRCLAGVHQSCVGRYSRNVTLSPEVTDCEDAGMGSDGESSSMVDGQHLIPLCGVTCITMPVLEDGLSSGHTSDTDNNNPTVLLMKRQISEIEREIIERTNRASKCDSIDANASEVHSNSQETGIQLLDSLVRPDESRTPPPPAPTAHRSANESADLVEAAIHEIRSSLRQTKPLKTTNVDDDISPGCSPSKDSTNSNTAKTEDLPIWVPRHRGTGSGPSGDEEEADTDLETDRLLGQQRTDDTGFFDEKSEKDGTKKKARNKEVLIEGVLFRARYLGSTQLACEGQPTKSTRMMQAEEAVSRIKALAPDGETQPSTEVDLFISTEKIMVLNTDLKEIMMDHALRTISYIADIGELVVLMARRRCFLTHQPSESTTETALVPSGVNGIDKTANNRTPKMICHVFESDEAQFIAQSIGQAFQVAYMEFLKANGIEDHSFVKEMDYQEVLNSQEIFGDELQMFAKKELQKEVVVPKSKGEILGVVIVESGWGSMLPTVVIANLAPAGAAARCGQLNIGDQIIAINGVSLVGLPLSTCQNYIKNSKPQTVIKLTVVPCAPVVEVKIKRPDTKYQLGFSVQNGVICSLLRGGIAERGGVRVGHRIIEINNQSVVAVPHEKIVNLLATSVGEILMKTMPTSMFRLLTGQETPVFI